MDGRFTFYLGTHHPAWLRRPIGPLFVSHKRLREHKRLPHSVNPWALDSGAYTELSKHGRWTTTAESYITATRRYAARIGNLQWAAPMDWMCEPDILAKTGLTVLHHQYNTVENFLELRTLAPDLPYIPVIQGWTLADYLRCVDMYSAVGIDLTREPLVGVGSICSRQSTTQVAQIIWELADLGLRLHGFGVKRSGICQLAGALVSADSMAWSFRARRDQPLPGCKHRKCTNCIRYATHWRTRLLRDLHPQLRLRV